MRTFGVMTLPVFIAMLCASGHAYAQAGGTPPPPATSSSASDVLPAPPPAPPIDAGPAPLPTPPDQPALTPPLPPPPLAPTPPLPAPTAGSTPSAIPPGAATLRPPSISGPGAEAALMKSEERWYGWQTLLAAAPANLVGLIGILSDAPGAAMAAYPLNAFAGPIVHWAHGNVGRGFATLGLNLSVPLLFAVLGTAAGGSNDYGGPIGMNLGLVTTQLIDTLGWSRETVRVPVMQPKGTQALAASSIGVVPMIQSTQKGIMLVGQF